MSNSTLLFTTISIINPWTRVLLEKLLGSQLVKKFPAFYGTRKFITEFTSTRHLSLSWASSIQSIRLHPTSITSILILSSHLRLGLLRDLFFSGFPNKTMHITLLSTIRATWPTHHILLEFITQKILGKEYRSFRSSLCSFLHSLVKLRTKFSPRHPNLKHPQPALLPQFKRQNFTSIRNKCQNYSSVYLNL